MATRLTRRAALTRISPDPVVASVQLPSPPNLPGYELIADTETSSRRTWSSFQIAAAIAAGGGGGGSGNSALWIATGVGGSANAIDLTVPGLTLSATPVLVQFDPAQDNTGPAQVRVNGGAWVTLQSRQNQALDASALIATIPALIRISTTNAKIISGSI